MVRRSNRRRTLPPLNAVRAFEAAARLRSFKEAATELGVTQGAISQQIRTLEQWLGPSALFVRSARGIKLTASGAALLAEVGPALDRIAAAARHHIGREGQSLSAILKVNALATFSLRWLLPRMNLFRVGHPDIEVQLTTSNDSIDALPESFDVVIRGGPDSFLGYTSRPFLTERRLPVCKPSILTDRPIVTVSDLSQHTLLHVTSMPRLWSEWLVAANHTSMMTSDSLTFDHFYLTIQAALDGLGVAMGPTALVADAIASGALVTPFPDISLPARSYYAYVPEGQLSPPSLLFCQWLEAQGGEQ